MARTSTERLKEVKQELELAFSLINELWADEHLDILLGETNLSPDLIRIRRKIISTRIAILNASNQVELLLANN